MKRNLDSENTPFIVNHNIIKIKFAAILIAALLAFSCGGGGGGGGMVAFAPSEGGAATPHNGGDAGGWGTGNSTGNGFNPQGQGIEESEAGLLISQMAALSDITGVTIELTINGTPYPAINADETTTTAVLPKIKAGDKISGKATINLMDAQPRIAYLDETEATLHGVLKFKVPYNFKAYDLSGTLVKEDTYFARDGINLAAQTVDPIAGWQCIDDGTTHYGSYVTGVRGDITLNAVLGDGAPVLTATASQNVLYARATSSDTTTITITNVTGIPHVSATLSSVLSIDPPMQDTADPSKYTVVIRIAGNSTPVWFTDSASASVTITDDGGNQTSLPLTLKNKYSYQLQTVGAEWTDDPALISTYDYTTTAVEIEQGGTLTFAAAAAALNGHYPTDREIVSFYYDDLVTAYYNKLPTPATITFSSASLTSRNVLLKALPDLRINRNLTIGGYAGTTPQDGSFNNPYQLNYYGTATQRKIQIEIYDKVCKNGNLTLVPDPSQTNIDTIMSTMFTITHDDNKFTYELKSDLAKNSVYVSPIKLIATDPTTGATKDVWISVVKVGIGNKDTPNAIGDIVFTDGTAMAYTAFNNLAPAEKNAKSPYAVAVIFYVGGNAKLSNRILGLGINSYDGNTYSGTPLGSSAKERLYFIDAIKSEPHFSEDASNIDGFINLINGDVDGSDNFSAMASYFTSNGMTNDTETSGKYPAFQWPRDTYPGTRSNLTGTPYATGWYLPTLPEMLMIFKNKSTVESALAVCGSGVTATLPGGEYWTFSASTIDDHTHTALTLFNMSTGKPDWADGFGNKKILAIRRFN